MTPRGMTHRQIPAIADRELCGSCEHLCASVRRAEFIHNVS